MCIQVCDDDANKVEVSAFKVEVSAVNDKQTGIV